MKNVSRALKNPKDEAVKVDGVDIFVRFKGTPGDLGPQLENLAIHSAMKLKMISNRGTKVYPGETQADCSDHWRCRFTNRNGAEIADRQIYDLLFKMTEQNIKWMHVEKLQMMDGKMGWTKAQGED